MRTPWTGIGVVLAALTVTFLTALPAAAETGVVYDGDDPGPGYTALETLGLFVLIPLAVFALVILGVYAPGWVRANRGVTAADESPLWVTSQAGSMAPPSGPGMITPSAPTDHVERGGSSAQW